MAERRPIRLPAPAILLAFALLPLWAYAVGQPYQLVLFTRTMILGLAATGVDLLLGYGGMVSLGHAMYLGVGAYSVGVLSFHGIDDGFAQIGTALVAGTLLATVVGAVCLRARGMAFIMITLAFAQMGFFLVVGMKQYGGDDGLALATRSRFGSFAPDDPRVLYYAVYVLLLVTLYCIRRLASARFGLVLRACRQNQDRLPTLGIPLFRYRLVAYVLSALICTLAGVLLANLTRFASPAYMQWQMSGELVVMAVLGGSATSLGPLVGAATLLLFEEALASLPAGLPFHVGSFLRDHGSGLVGLLVIVVASLSKHGLYGRWGASRRGAR